MDAVKVNEDFDDDDFLDDVDDDFEDEKPKKRFFKKLDEDLDDYDDDLSSVKSHKKAESRLLPQRLQSLRNSQPLLPVR